MKGIYKITCTSNNRVYIGKSVDINMRRNSHFSLLRNGFHFNIYLQRAWNKYGESSFFFEIVEECEEDCLNDREIFWIKECQAHSRKKGFNLAIPERDRPFRHSEESKKRMCEVQKGHPVSQEQREKIRSTLRKKHLTGEINIAALGKAHSKKVSQYTMEGVFIKEWDSLSEASSTLNINVSNLSGTCYGRYQHCGGYRWGFGELPPLKQRKYRDVKTYTGKRKINK